LGNFEELGFGQEFYFQWHITESCNLRCKHCYHVNYDSKGELSSEELLQVLDLLDNAAAKWGKLATLSITGGEPLLRLNEVKQIVDRIESKNHIYYFDLLTNGTFLDDNALSFLSKSTKLRRVQLSLEGSDSIKNDEIRGQGSFEKIITGIRSLKAHQIPICIMVTLTRENVDEISEIVALAIDLGIDYLSFERFIPEGAGLQLKGKILGQEELKLAYQMLARFAQEEKRVKILTYRPLFALCGDDLGAMCSVGNNALTIMHDGIVYPCRRLPIPLGNILKEGLYKIWYDSDLLWEIRDCNNLKGKCNSCEMLTSCRGCRAAAYYISGDYLAEDPQCWK
jgi:radical SAM protein with 4Fe4S-binding SPASM domain